ncbi:MAG TPA: competence/damage-inducible protein A [Caldisericia bacterium]|nr:competence/damage-inducible protein A [Caldisericia bacterium]HPF48754.1 competence/damage-inducible protein A [Caldisericia bacterium]HPI83586.1 competence/damage-inducible protein A [Caldisericia bacterium]HPQ93209.1 competence/damage-inducible protein A [Caldisericia bacterium]HRV74958.1 competence/damage-inducible protein A [Caldisericia bacterium]
MDFSVIAVGNEVLFGDTVNTTTPWLTSRLVEAGHNPSATHIVPDETESIKEILRQSLSVSDIVVLTGGLGPTPDDLTKEAVCEYLGIELTKSDEVLEQIKDVFAKREIEMPQSNIKQAFVPRGATILKNTVGTAPGFMIERGGKKIFLLPGPPKELYPMVLDNIELFCPQDNGVYSEDFYVLGMPESKIADALKDILELGRKPMVATYASPGQIRLRVWCGARSADEFAAIASETIETIRERLEGHVFDKPVNETLAELLRQKGLTISTAESCTGGLISKTITDLAGSSDYFKGGVCSYSNEAKTEFLGVPAGLINSVGAVSQKVALEMAKGAREKFKSDIAISTTGIAGPGGGTPEKPVGLVWMSISTPYETFAFKRVFGGDRQMVRERAMVEVMWRAVGLITKEMDKF